MLLYCTAGPVLLFYALGHYLKYNKKEKMVLMIDKNTFQRRNAEDAVFKLKEKGLIFDVLSVPILFDRKRHISVSEYEKYCIDFFKNLFYDTPYKIDDFEKIYCLNDTWDGHINLYLNLKKIHYIYLAISKNYPKENAAAFCSNEFKEVIKKHKFLTPFADYAIPELMKGTSDGNLNLIKKDYSLWDKTEAIDSLTEKQIYLIADCFNTLKEINSNSILLLLNSYGYMTAKMSELSIIEKKHLGLYDYSEFEVFIDMYKIALDYYASENNYSLYIKPHPNDPISDEQLCAFENNIQIISAAPSEILIPYLKYTKVFFKKIIGFASTSLDTIDESLGEKITLGDSFIRSWHFYDSICCSLELCEYLNITVFSSTDIREQLVLLNNKYNYRLIIKDFDILKWLELPDEKSSGEAVYVIDCQHLIKNNISFDSVIERSNKKIILVFINALYADDLFNSNYLGHIISFKIIKNKNNQTIDDSQCIWVYCPNKYKSKRLELVKFNKKIEMPWRKICVDFQALSPEEMLREYYFKYNSMVPKLSSKINIIDYKINIISKTSNDADYESIANLLKTTKDMLLYLNVLKKLTERYLIIIGTKDTPGSRLAGDVITELHNIGFSEFSKDLWKMYCGVIINGKIIIDDSEPEHITRSLVIDGTLRIKIICRAWRSGNSCSIIIDGTDYAVNQRGINIVVFDTERKIIIDSVCFDSHSISENVYRK